LPAEVRADLEVLHRHAQRVAALAQGLLSFSRQRPRQRSAVDLNRVVDDVLLLVAPQIAKSGVAIGVGLHPELPHVTADGQALQQVVLNLITNAWEAGAGQITVETRPIGDPPDRVEIVVADTGPGIAPEDQRRMFDAFFTTRSDGTGLGLSITHGIVRDHEGTIHVESEPGKGTRFVISLPRA
jgi:two-component system NtrC family sensor kinase